MNIIKILCTYIGFYFGIFHLFLVNNKKIFRGRNMEKTSGHVLESIDLVLCVKLKLYLKNEFLHSSQRP